MPLLRYTPSPAGSDRLLPLLSAEAMRAADEATIEHLGIPGFTLMETAARGVAAVIEEAYGPVRGRRVACLCGKGNNGGDGLALARVLHAWGAHVQVITLAEADTMSPDAAHNARLLSALADERLHADTFSSLRQLAAFTPPDLYIDALLGTGLTSELRAPISDIVQWLNSQSTPVVAVDVPTGLHSDTGAVLGTAVQAEHTVTMAALKAGHVLGEGPARCGRVTVVDIGIPPHTLDAAADQHAGCARLVEDAAVRTWLPARGPDAYKYSVGLALIVGGSPGMTGAPVMAATAAARAGAGYVQCAAHEAILPTLAAKLTSVTSLALPASDKGTLDPDAALDALRPRLEKSQAILIGPGLGRDPATQHFVRRLLAVSTHPVVIDADGLNALDADFLRKHANERWVLTPHAGEFKRLAGDIDLSDRLHVVQSHAQAWGCTLVLKGFPSLVAAPDGRTLLSLSGGPALATAGTGDVLAGLTVGLAAQGLEPLHAAAAALHLGGSAADYYAQRRHPHSLVATDLVDALPAVLHERFYRPAS